MPSKFILSIRPKEYLKQGLSHCGVYAINGILSAYGLDSERSPEDYHVNWIGRLSGTTLGKNYYARILQSYGVNASVQTANNLSQIEKVALLKNLLKDNNPVMLMIGNGYITDTYNPILGKLIGHWITLWGYDDKRRIFYVYDSALPKKYWSRIIPIGNTIRSYNEVLRDWRFGKWQLHRWFLMGLGNYMYIKVRNVDKKV